MRLCRTFLPSVRAASAVLAFSACAYLADGQTGAAGTGATTSSRALALPSSGRMQTGTADASESAAPGNGVATLNSSVSISGDLAGSIPNTALPPGPVTLTLADALRMGFAANLGPVSAANSVRASRAQRIQGLSALLPNISANASETVAQVNLAAYGFQFKVPPGFNFTIPSVVGPFTYSQLQGQVSQTVFDQVQRRNWQASKESEKASILAATDVRETVALAVGGTYLQVLALTATVSSQRAQVNNAQAVYQQAVTRKAAGVNAKIDVVRSLVELETQQQRLSSVTADLRKQKIAFARIIGVPLDRELALSESLSFRAAEAPTPDVQIGRAWQNRADLRAAQAQVKAAELALSAARAERLPSVSINGNYGVLGPNPTSAHGVFNVTGSINVPIWQGGRVRGDIQEAEATLDQRRAELADQKAKVESDVRTALIELETAGGQVQVAENNRKYSAETLSEARDRFAAGVATTVEVVQAEEQVAAAENDYISSLYSFDLAKLSLGRATGNAEQTLPNLLKGNLP